MLKSTVEGSFSASVIRDGVEILLSPRSKNLILQGQMSNLDLIGGSLGVGTGNTAPTFSDASLVSKIAETTGGSWINISNTLSGDVYTKESSKEFTFAIGAVIGNISELGLSTSGGASTLRTRALFKDGGGLPTTITVTALDQLVVTYFVKKAINMLPTTTSMVATTPAGPVTIDYIIRPCIASGIKAGVAAEYPTSTYSFTNAGLYMSLSDVNNLSIDPVTYIPTKLSNSLSTSTEGTVSASLTGTGSEVTHNINFPIASGNMQWISATFATGSGVLNDTNVLFQIEFIGPNYITKLDTDTVSFQLKELVNQVL